MVIKLITAVEADPREIIPSVETRPPPNFDSCHHIMSGITDTVNVISCSLEDSQQARNTYTCDWSAIFEDYNRDIQQFDERLQEIMQIHKHNANQREKRAGHNTNNRHQHSLNYHVQQSDHDGQKRVFELPPTGVNAEKGGTSNDLDDALSLATEDQATPSIKKKHLQQPSEKQMRENEQKRKLASLGNLLGSFNDMRVIELDLLRQINESGSDLDSQKVIDLQLTLEECQYQQSRDMVALISSFQLKVDNGRPSLLSYKGKKKGLPTVERILQDVEKVKGDAHTLQSKNDNLCNSHKSFVQISTKLSNAGMQGRNGKKLCEEILKDDEQFVGLENLPFRPTSHLSSLREVVVPGVLSKNEATCGGDALDNLDDDECYSEEEFESYMEYETSSFEDKPISNDFIFSTLNER